MCQFKNGFFGRRYPGVYADMGLDRISWYADRGFTDLVKPFMEIREEKLPTWLREECESVVVPRKEKAAKFALTGVPYRYENLQCGLPEG
jgi:hypothetical protein